MPSRSARPHRRLFDRERRRNRRLPLSLVIIALLLAVFSLVTPSHLPVSVFPGSVSLPTETPAPTPPPTPTDVHGGHIVFTCTRKEINQICMIGADGTGYQQLTQGISNSYYPAISRDGSHIVFAVNEYDAFDLYRFSLRALGGSRTSESQLKRLTDYVGNAFSPSFSPDGQQIMFLNRVAEGPAALWVMGSDGHDPHAIFTPPSDIVAAAWSPDGLQAAFAMTVGRAFAYEVFMLDMANVSAAPRQVSHGNMDIGGSISWSPDQTDVLVFAGPAAAREIFRLDLTTGAATQLTFGGNNASASYSPDGDYIVFNSLRNDGQADLYIMRADGHSLRRLTENPEPDWQPEWGP